MSDQAETVPSEARNSEAPQFRLSDCRTQPGSAVPVRAVPGRARLSSHGLLSSMASAISVGLRPHIWHI
eukprot:763135-Hanusia_phi.AAC.6